MPDNHTPIGMVSVGETLWIATAEGSLLRFDSSEGLFLEDIDVGTELVDISLVSDINDRFGHAIWVAGADGSLHRYDSDDAKKTTTYELAAIYEDADRPLLVQNPGIDVQHVVMGNGDVVSVGEDMPPGGLTFQTGIRGLNAAMFDGRLWLLGESLLIVPFGQ